MNKFNLNFYSRTLFTILLILFFQSNTFAQLLPPSVVTATPSTICLGSTSNLSAVSNGNVITWWDASTGGTLLGSSVSGANFTVLPTVTTTYYAESFNSSSNSQTFVYSSFVIQTWTIPSGVTSIDIDALGASGGYDITPTFAGNGARMQGTFSVTPGTVLSILVGQCPGQIIDSSGLDPFHIAIPAGGGGTFIALGASYATATPMIVAGGGGGGYAGHYSDGGQITTSGTGPTPGINGNGAPSGTCGGGGGGFYSSGGNDTWYGFGGGQGFQQGGMGGVASGYTYNHQTGGFGGGAPGNNFASCRSHAGHGGGYSGGSSDTVVNVSTYTGHGGGSYNSGTNQNNAANYNVGHGMVIISWTNTASTSSTRTSVTVVVNSVSVAATSTSATPSSICSGNTTQLSTTGGSLGTSANWFWYSGSCGGTLEGSGTNIIISPTTTTDYYVRAEGTCNTTACDYIQVTVNATPTITNISATPSTICLGNTSDLSATSAGNIITWWNASSGGTLFGSSTSGANFIVSPTTTTTYYAEASQNGSGASSMIFNYIGYNQTWTVPAGISSINIDARGGQGADYLNSTGGLGGRVQTLLAVTPNQTLNIYIGQGAVTNTGGLNGGANGGSANGGGGGGATDIRTGGVSLMNRIIVAAGGGGAGFGCTNDNGGAGGGITGGNGLYCNISNSANCGYGGTQTSGGFSATNGGTSGTLGNGGTCTNSIGGGGGGGYYGGGSGYYGGGGGGSSWVDAANATQTTYTQGYQTGNGIVIISWNGTTSCISTRVSITVVVDNSSSTVPNSATGTPASICAGNSTTLSLSGGSLGLNGNWNWYTGSCAGTYVKSGAAPVVSPASSTTYFVRAENLCSTTTCVSISIEVIQLPSMPSAIIGNSSPVNGNTEIYSITTVSGVNYTWAAPSGWIGTSTTDSITYTIGAINGILSVIPNNSCGNGIGRSIIIGTGGLQISGTFTYDNNAQTPLDSIMVYIMLNGSNVDSVQADVNGNYQFNNIPDGAYNITATTNKPWNGVNITDVVLTKKHFAGSIPLTSSLRIHAADVNISQAVNVTDAIKIARRYAGSDTSFDRGSWIFEKPFGGDTLNLSTYLNDTVIVNGVNVVQNFKGLCIGDVNGSYNTIPVGNKSLIINNSRRQLQEGVIRSEKIKTKSEK